MTNFSIDKRGRNDLVISSSFLYSTKKMALSLFLWDEPLLTSAQSPGSGFFSGAQ
jgi:hypothetical protein